MYVLQLIARAIYIYDVSKFTRNSVAGYFLSHTHTHTHTHTQQLSVRVPKQHHGSLTFPATSSWMVWLKVTCHSELAEDQQFKGQPSIHTQDFHFQVTGPFTLYIYIYIYIYIFFFNLICKEFFLCKIYVEPNPLCR